MYKYIYTYYIFIYKIYMCIYKSANKHRAMFCLYSIMFIDWDNKVVWKQTKLNKIEPAFGGWKDGGQSNIILDMNEEREKNIIEKMKKIQICLSR